MDVSRAILRLNVAVVAAAFAGAGMMGAASAASARSQQSEESVNAACAVPTASPARRSSTPQWNASLAVQESLAAVTAQLDRRFGKASKASHGHRLARGLIGPVLNDKDRSIVVVVDPARVDTKALSTGLESAVREVRLGAGRSAPVLPVRVQPSCHSARELVAADQVIADRNWHPQARKVTFLSYLDAASSTFHATFWPKDKAVADALKRAIGNRVVVSFGRPSQFSGRNDDVAPHKGGAKVSIFGGIDPNISGCTAGFSVIFFNDGRRGSVTAGHCFNNDDVLLSGTQFYGQVEGKDAFPAFDMARINDFPGQTFSNVIYTDPGVPTTRTVTGSATPSVGQTVCVSGQRTRAKCQLEVIDFTGRLCVPEGCTEQLMRARRPGVIVGRQGDSGGPVYTQGANNTAVINGMVVGGTEIISAPDGAQMILAETIENIEIGLSVVVATS